MHLRTGGPLDGITVLDLSTYIAGPYGCTLLADLGARVIKIESPAGDNLRQYPSTLAGESRAFLGINRSKLGLALDLKKPDGQAVLHRMIGQSDVLVHNFRPSVPDRLGIPWEKCHAGNPKLIYCALTGFGDTGPMKEKAGYDQVLQSLAGICSFQGSEEPEIVYGSVVDYYAAALLANGVTAALFARERSGEGQYVGISLLRTALAMQSARFIWAKGEGRAVDRDMRSGGITGIHPAREGFIYISANTPHFWKALCSMIGLPALATEPRYDTIRKRAENAQELVPLLRQALQARTALEWEELFGEEVPCSAVREIEDMFDHPQVLAEDIVAEFSHPTLGTYRGMKEPILFKSTPCPEPLSAPAIGADSAAVLAAFGYAGEEIEKLKSSGAVPESR
jgi:formyl-CoA transferase